MKSRFLWIQGSLIPLSFLTGLGILWLSPAVAQTSAPVDPPATPAPPEPNLPIEPVSQVLIKEIRVVGSTLFTPQQLKSIVSSYEGKELKVDDLKALLNAITQLYLNQGYYTSRALYSDNAINNGILTIQVQEKSAPVRISWEGNSRLSNTYILDRLPAASPLNVPKLEDQLKVLRDDPHLSKVQATLRRNTKEGVDEVIVQAQEARPFYGKLSADNFSAPTLGSNRFGLLLGTRNLSGVGDGLSADYKVTTSGGYHSLDLNYELPVNGRWGTVQFRSTFDFSKVTEGAFKNLDLQGNRSRYELSYRQPIRKTSLEELALSSSIIYTTGTTFLYGVPTRFGLGSSVDGKTRTTVFRFGQEYIRRDPKGAWVGSSNFNFGLGIFNATKNVPPTPDGEFFSWTGQFQRLQRLNQQHLLLAQLDLQLSPHTLLPADQFALGGGQSLRGYRQNVLLADNGFRFSVEDRITLMRDEGGLPTFQVAPFMDMGAAINTKNNPNSLSQPQNFLAGIGFGLIWEPLPNLHTRLDYGYPLVNLKNTGNDLQDKAVYFNGSYEF